MKIEYEFSPVTEQIIDLPIHTVLLTVVILVDLVGIVATVIPVLLIPIRAVAVVVVEVFK